MQSVRFIFTFWIVPWADPAVLSCQVRSVLYGLFATLVAAELDHEDAMVWVAKLPGPIEIRWLRRSAGRLKKARKTLQRAQKLAKDVTGIAYENIW